jgi:hypothetical protein
MKVSLSCVEQDYRKMAIDLGFLNINILFVRLVADGWCWFVLREKYCWLVGGG